MRFKLLILAMLLVPAAVHAQQGHPLSGEIGGPTRDDLGIRYGWLRQVLGFTFCANNQGYSFIAAGLSEIDRLDVEAHELKHKEQMARYASCEAFDEAMLTLKGRVLLESEGYAAGLCVSVKHGVDRISLERNYSERISYAVAGGKIPPVVIAGIIRSYEQC